MLLYNLFFILLNIIEAKHDYHVIQGASHDNVIDNRKWHQWGGAFSFVLAIFFSFTISKYLGIMYLGYRAFIFPMSLNLFRGKPLFYLSKAGFEGWFVSKNIKILYYLGALITIILSNIL